MKRPGALVVVVAGLLALLLWLLLRDSQDAGTNGRSRASVSATTATGHAGQSGAPNLAATVGAAAGEEGPSSGRATSEAFHELHRVLVPTFDGCIGPVRARRTAVSLELRFERVRTTAVDARYAVRDVIVRERVSPAVRDCLDRLRGNELALPAESTLAASDSFSRPMTMFVPVLGPPGDQR